MENTTLHFDWAAPMATDIDAARRALVASSLSLHPPRRRSASPLSLLWLSLASALARGVSLDFFLPTPSRSHPATAMNGHAADELHKLGATVHFLPVENLLHAKTLSIDNEIAWVGSGNWTAAASAHNHEAYIRVINPQMATTLSLHWLNRSKIKGA